MKDEATMKEELIKQIHFFFYIQQEAKKESMATKMLSRTCVCTGHDKATLCLLQSSAAPSFMMRKNRNTGVGEGGVYLYSIFLPLSDGGSQM